MASEQKCQSGVDVLSFHKIADCNKLFSHSQKCDLDLVWSRSLSCFSPYKFLWVRLGMLSVKLLSLSPAPCTSTPAPWRPPSSIPHPPPIVRVFFNGVMKRTSTQNIDAYFVQHHFQHQQLLRMPSQSTIKFDPSKHQGYPSDETRQWLDSGLTKKKRGKRDKTRIKGSTPAPKHSGVSPGLNITQRQSHAMIRLEFDKKENRKWKESDKDKRRHTCI